MGASRVFTSRHVRRTTVAFVATGGVAMVAGTAADASDRQPFLATTSNADGIVLIALAGGILLLAVIGFVIFTWLRRKRRPSQCAQQREALAQAEQAVQYWEAARAHLAAVGRTQSMTPSTTDDPSHASLVAKANDGLSAAIKQRDQCQMDLINCMASGVPALPVPSAKPVVAQPFFIPGSDDTSSS
jgi:predicted lipid-binding transport protein (Tim44 family)